MRALVLFSLLSAATLVPVWADHSSPGKLAAPERQATLLPGLGELHHPVSTKNAEAQAFFDQGLRLIYAFNHDEALRSFRRAAELDPNLAMAHWGMALAVGPNYNLDAEEAALKDAFASIQRAQALAKEAPEHERDYIAALAQRYVADPKPEGKAERAAAYCQAMRALAKKYPDDLDAATLFAESAMNLRPWMLWSPDGKPADGTLEIVETLERVLARAPNHIGANHYYIHAVEASPWPERGLGAALRLEHLAPGAGHLVHMPSHIHSRLGDHAEAARINERAAAVDLAYLVKFDVRGVYPLMYYSHNLHFAATAHALQGRLADASAWANRLAEHVGPHVAAMPMLEFFMTVPLLVQVHFSQWYHILALPRPDSRQSITTSVWHFARGMAFCCQEKLSDAEQELAAFRKLHEAMSPDLMHGDRNKAKEVLTVPLLILEAKVAALSNEPDRAVSLLRQAVAAEEKLNYIEPADWPFSSRVNLGGQLLRLGRPAEAEVVFRDDLQKNRRNPKSLFGLVESLKAQGREQAARLVSQEFEAAWKLATVKLRLQDL